jgi:hypothetical protein
MLAKPEFLPACEILNRKLFVDSASMPYTLTYYLPGLSSKTTSQGKLAITIPYP